MTIKIENIDTSSVSLDALAKAFPDLSIQAGEVGSDILLKNVEYVVQMENSEIALVKKGGDIAFKIHCLNYKRMVVY